LFIHKLAPFLVGLIISPISQKEKTIYGRSEYSLSPILVIDHIWAGGQAT